MGSSRLYEAVDHQISLDLGGRGSRQLYEAARREAAAPLIEGTANCLQRAIEPNGPILLTTGFPIRPSNSPETDGPLGTVVLARALETLGATPVVVVDERTRPIIEALFETLAVEERTESADTAPESLLARHEPTAVVAVETAGRTADGSYRNMAGEDISSLVTPMDELFVRAADRGIPTLGIGDGGNEIGMGTITPTVERVVDHGSTVASVTPTDQLVVAGVSNWGAYGLVCGLSLATGQQLLHTGETERRLLAAAVEAGAVDGVTGVSTESVDGIPVDVHAHVVEILAHCCR